MMLNCGIGLKYGLLDKLRYRKLPFFLAPMPTMTTTDSKRVKSLTAQLLFVCAVLHGGLVHAQTTPAGSGDNSGMNSSAPNAQKSLQSTKADINELTYVANADNCSAKALHLPVDHGPRATTTSYLNEHRIAECYGRVR
jgi:hypothetical protein